MTTRLAAAVVGVSLVALLVATLVGLAAGRDLGRELYEDRLVAMRASASFDAAAQIGSLRNTTEALASSPRAAAAIDAFAAAHAELRATVEVRDEEREALVETYQERYLQPLRDAGRTVNLRDVITGDSAAAYLQFHYAVDLRELSLPEAVVDARDGSTWTEAHREVHPVYRDVVSRAGLDDLYLIEPDDGYVVYSVRKRPDLGTSLDTGPFSGSGLASITAAVRDDPSRGVIASDLSFYDPALTTPVGVVAAPVMDGIRLAGVLVLMYDSAPLTHLLTAGGDWDAGRFPTGGETFLVGADGTTRSEPRSFIENPRAHLDAAQEAGTLTAQERAFIEASGTTVLTQRVADATADAGPDGDDDVRRRATMDGREAFSTTFAVADDDLRWWTVAELEVDAAEGDLSDFQEVLVVGSSVFVVGLAFLAVGWANGIVRPVRAISDRLGSERRWDPEPLDLPPRTPIEFQRLAGSFESMSDALRNQQAELTAVRESRLLLLRRLLPSNVADRVAEGDVRSLEELTDVSAVVLVVVGLDTADPASPTSDRELVERLHAELDDLAEQHGLERVKVVGDAYFAACGHDRPYLDHVPRSVAFAADAENAVGELRSSTVGQLGVAVGIDVGRVTVGMTGGTRMVYDVWGPAVTGAHRLARRAHAGQVLCSDSARRRLPESIGATRADDDPATPWVVDASTAAGRS